MALLLAFFANQMHIVVDTKQDSAGINSEIGSIFLQNTSENKSAQFFFTDDEAPGVDFDTSTGVATVTRPFAQHASFLAQVNSIRQSRPVYVAVNDEEGDIQVTIGTSEPIPI